MRAGDLDHARALLAESLDDMQPSTLTATSALVAWARLAMAEGATRQAAVSLGAADGLRKRAGLRAWPLTRRDETVLLKSITQTTDPEIFAEAFAAGAELHQRESLALVRDGIAHSAGDGAAGR